MTTTLIRDTERLGRIVLTTDSPVSHYNIPVLRVEDRDWPDLGPVNTLPSGITAAEFVCRWTHTLDLNGLTAARQFCAQWPEGPQPTDERMVNERGAMWEEDGR